MLLLSILIHAMMQQFTIAEGFDCTVSCKDDCPLEYFQGNNPSPEVFIHLKNTSFGDVRSSQPRTISQHLLTCCNLKCREFCVTSDNEIVPNGHEWTDFDDPCLQHVCNRGIISNHSSLCSSLPCPYERHILTPGECCPTCSTIGSPFCPGDEFCGIACEFGFAVDTQRHCDLCTCAKKETETSTSSPSESSTSNNDEAPRKNVQFYFYLDPTDASTRILLVGLAVTLGVLLVASLVGIGWYFHRRVYRQVPLLSLRNASA